MKKTVGLLFTIVGAFSLIGCSSGNKKESKDDPVTPEVTTYTVTFDSHGGSEVAAMKTDKIYTTPVTTREGYVFNGWYDSAQYVNKIVFPYTVTKDITLHANWKANGYSVTFDTDGGSAVEMMKGITEISTAPITTKEGYVLDGWFTSKTATEPVSFPYTVDHDQTLYAQWTRDTSVIILDGIADEDIWTEEVLSKEYTVNYSDDYKTEVHALKKDEGFYIYASQHVKEIKNEGVDWWLRDNLEFRFATGSSYYNCITDLEQKWISTTNGGASNFAQYGVKTHELNEETGLYDVGYEIYVTYEELGFADYESVVFVAGSKYINDAWKSGIGWGYASEEIRHLPLIGENGIEKYTYGSYGGEEQLESEISGEWDGGSGNWNSGIFTLHMDGSESWMVNLHMNSKTATSKLDDIGAGIVGEVYSPSWSSGGWTFRKDWYGWGSWHDLENGYRFNYTEICDHAADGDDWNNRCLPLVRNALSDIEVEALIKYDADNDIIVVNMLYTCGSTTDYEGKKISVSYYVKCPYSGEMIVGFGYNYSAFSIDSAKVVLGTVIE